MLISSAESVAINDDLLTDILLRLPLKSVARFKSVSWQWLSLISTTPRFAFPKPVDALLLQQTPHVHDLHLLPLHDHSTHTSSTSSSFPFRSLAFLPQNSPIRLTSCNGLFLCHEATTQQQQIVYHVFNPTTTHHTHLPPLAKLSYFSGYISWEPSKSNHYKVISFHLPTLRLCEIAIYSSETRNWMPIGEDASRTIQLSGLCVNLRKGVVWNGAVHWISRGKSFLFNAREEKWQENPTLTIDRYPKLGFDYFGVCWGRLYLVVCSEIYHKDLKIYEMESEGFRWSLKYEVEIGLELTTSFPEMVPSNHGNYLLYRVQFLGQPINVNEEPYLVLQIKSQLVCYYFRTRVIGKIYDLLPNVVDHRTVPLYGVHQYIESLVHI